MHFQLEHDAHSWGWRLEKSDGHALAQAPTRTATEYKARQQITAFRKAAGGIKFAKVLGP